MGKNHRHKKNLKAEKGKTKLKATKTQFLPKGGNVTDTNFKIKPIVIQSQLKANTFDEPLTIRKLNLHDLLNRLKHHNTSVRFEGCEGLIELLNNCSVEVIRQNLYCLIPGISKLFADREQKVRRKAIAVVEKILEKVPSDNIRSFVHTLSLFMACAMTHIDGYIKEDSLLIVDIFLKHGKPLIPDIFDTILPNFLNLISRLRKDSSLNRTLTMNLGSTMTITKWRIEVLNRLYGILQALIEDERSHTQVNACQVKHEDDVGRELIIPLYKSVGSVKMDTSKDTTKTNIRDYFDVLLPLLHETIVEVLPLNSQTDSTDEEVTIIQQDAGAVLSCVLEIYNALYTLMNGKRYKVDRVEMLKLFHSKGSEKVFIHILKQFPYRHQTSVKRKFNKDMNKLMETSTDAKCLKDNLNICCIFATLYRTFSNQFVKSKVNDILAYLKMCLTNRNYVGSKNVEKLVLTLRIIFFNNFSTWTAKNINLDFLIDGLVHFYDHSCKDVQVFKLLGDIVHIGGCSQRYASWLSALPLTLLKPTISLDKLNVIVNVARSSNSNFLNALSDSLPDILHNLLNIRIDGEDVHPPLLKIVCMLNFVTLDSEKVLMLKKFIEKTRESKVSTYLEEVLQFNVIECQ